MIMIGRAIGGAVRTVAKAGAKKAGPYILGAGAGTVFKPEDMPKIHSATNAPQQPFLKSGDDILMM
ncbi:hypothetical protein [Chromobacterium vaccinii]|uniref:hypothetical protein n=1 Tax=Chromobacterium vaccinii TaxID=1108595 RepID=UPI0011C07C7D|nr:hypothetical protein [Chromobacterium vaccinii]